MKKILYLSFLLLGTAVNAQYYVLPYLNANKNPGELNTDVEQTAAFMVDLGWTTILQPAQATPTWTATQTLPFSFEFNGSAVTQYKVSSSGVLTFDAGTTMAAPSSTRGTLPDASIPDQSVCIWGLNAAGANDGITIKTFGTAPNRQHYIMFASVGYGPAASPNGNWAYWSIVLEESTNAIYVIDGRTNGFAGINTVSMGLQIDNATAVLYNGSSDVTNMAGEDDSPANNTYYAFLPGTQPDFDIEMTTISTPGIIAQGGTDIEGTITNLGAQTITGLTLNYTIDGGAVVSEQLTGLNIASLGTYNFTHGTQWNAIPGAFDVEVYCTDLNGSNTDEQPANDVKTKSVSVLNELVQRLPLLEIFTSSTCAPCTPGNANFHSIMDPISSDNYVAIKYQQDFPGAGDPYRTVESVGRRNTPYGINSIPRMEIDGGWDGNANSYTQQLFDDAYAVPAFYKLEGDFSRVDKEFTIKVRFSPIVEATGERLYVAIIEHETFDNVGTNGETEFIDVMKKMVPNTAGTALPNTAVGAWDSLSFTYEFQGEYRLPANGQAANIINPATEHSVEEFSDLQVIAWVQDADLTVYQAGRMTDVSTTTGITETNMSAQDINIFPNPSNGIVNVEFNSEQADEITFVMVDMAGNVVTSFARQSNTGTNSIEINTAGFASGIYNLMIFDSNNNASVKKIAVQ